MNCCSDDNGYNIVRASAFRAVSTVNQNLPANTFVKVLFQNEQFDLANEYNPTTSILYQRLEVFTLLLEQLRSFPII